MNRPLLRSVIGCVIACGATSVGPTITGIGVANADLLGIGGGGGGIDVAGVDLLGRDKSNSGAAGESRVSSVSNAPSARSVVIRTKLEAAQPDVQTQPAAFVVPATDAPAVALGAPILAAVPAASAPPIAAAAPLAVPPPAAPVIRPPAPQAMLIPTTSAPGPGSPLAPADSLGPPTTVPDSFRAGYDEYLRAATTVDLIAVTLPGVAGIAGFTLTGAFAGYRQAQALQRALIAPVPTNILM